MLLKPCPFCGSSKLEEVRFLGTEWTQQVRCRSCNAGGPYREKNGDCNTLAYELWDERS